MIFIAGAIVSMTVSFRSTYLYSYIYWGRAYICKANLHISTAFTRQMFPFYICSRDIYLMCISSMVSDPGKNYPAPDPTIKIDKQDPDLDPTLQKKARSWSDLNSHSQCITFLLFLIYHNFGHLKILELGNSTSWKKPGPDPNQSFLKILNRIRNHGYRGIFIISCICKF